MAEIKDKICPFMSSAEKKVPCDTTCQMYGLSSCDTRTENSKKACTLSYLSYYLEEIARNTGNI